MGDLVFQKKLKPGPVQLEFKITEKKRSIDKKKSKTVKTLKRSLDCFGFESSDQPHLDKYL